VAQHDKRLNLGWLQVLALGFFLASLKDSLGLADPLGHLRIQFTDPCVGDAKVGRLEEGEHLLSMLVVSQ
jgi:hypothetical protein